MNLLTNKLGNKLDLIIRLVEKDFTNSWLGEEHRDRNLEE